MYAGVFVYFLWPKFFKKKNNNNSLVVCHNMEENICQMCFDLISKKKPQKNLVDN